MVSTHTDLESEQILIVDDEKRVLDAVARRIAQLSPSAEIVVTDRGYQAIKIIENQHFDLIISDLRLPHTDGSEVLRFARRIQPGALRVILSGQASASMLISALKSSHRYLEKPSNSTELAEILKLLRAIQHSEINRSLVDNILSFSALPVDARLLDYLRDQSDDDLTLALRSDIGLHLSAIRLGSAAYGKIYTANQLPALLLPELVKSDLISPIESHADIYNALRLLSIKAKLLEHKLSKLSSDYRETTSLSVAAYLGEYLLVSLLGAEQEIIPFIKEHEFEVAKFAANLWGLPTFLQDKFNHQGLVDYKFQVDNFMPLDELQSYTEGELLSMLCEVLCLKHY